MVCVRSRVSLAMTAYVGDLYAHLKLYSPSLAVEPLDPPFADALSRLCAHAMNAGDSCTSCITLNSS